MGCCLASILDKVAYQLLPDCVHQPLYFYWSINQLGLSKSLSHHRNVFWSKGLVVANGFYVVHLLQKAGIPPPCDHRFEPWGLKRATSLGYVSKRLLWKWVICNVLPSFWIIPLSRVHVFYEKLDSNGWVNGKPVRFEEVRSIQFATSICFCPNGCNATCLLETWRWLLLNRLAPFSSFPWQGWALWWLLAGRTDELSIGDFVKRTVACHNIQGECSDHSKYQRFTPIGRPTFDVILSLDAKWTFWNIPDFFRRSYLLLSEWLSPFSWKPAVSFVVSTFFHTAWGFHINSTSSRFQRRHVAVARCATV